MNPELAVACDQASSSTPSMTIRLQSADVGGGCEQRRWRDAAPRNKAHKAAMGKHSVHKLIASVVAAIVVVIGMRIAGVTFADLFKIIGKDASNAAADIKAVANGDYSKGNIPKQPRESAVAANEGDYDPELKK